jgi:methylmalonyl-CoA mutase cobalamin-binding subunit
VIDLSEEIKPNADQGQRMSLPREQSHPSTTAPPVDEAEQAMRKALGLFGDTPRSRPDGDRQDPGQRAGGGFMQGVHRRRFVQDGEVPVTVVRRDAPDAGGGQSGPTSSRLQRVEAALAQETAGRERAERALHEAQAALQASQTKMGHNDLAKNEAVAASKRHLEEVITLKEELAAAAERLHEIEARAEEAEEEVRTLRAELAEDRRGRKLAERLLREATEDAVLAPAHQPRDQIARAQIARASLDRVPARRGRPPNVHVEPEEEAEPVKWWLLPTKTTAKRR